MAWVLQFDGVNAYATINYSLVGETNFVLEFRMAFEDANNRFAVFGDESYVGNNVFCWDLNTASPLFQLRTSAGDIDLYSDIALVKGDFYTIKITKTGTSYELFVDSIPKETVISAEVFTGAFTRIGLFPTSIESKGKVEYITVSGTVSSNINLSATASSHTAGTPILVDTVSGNNATGVNMPTDGSAWVDLGDGGLAVIGNTANFNYNTITASIDLTGSIEVTGSTASFDYSAITGSIDLTGAILISGQTANFDCNAVNGLIDLTGELSVTGQTANFNYIASPADIDLTGEITVTGATSNFDHIGVNGVIELGAVINVVGQTANFDINGVNAEVSLTGEIIVTGQTATFNYTAISGSVIIGTGQKIGKVTAGFADSGISVQYKQSTITVKFGE
tara:strand:+ start:5958 stop:7139 length:1182 start_codon:yes stop_codon:yes gene_type:complete